ncbi:aldehyde dehydrogenase family protein [Nocardioides sp. zg-579]|uniref:Aldehyde dehydrogenase family protein n=1 Tax=Nocardioides marmotae TaxID=2663857 RepID=A0A6I3J3U9_9ACTN|nr:aldehyde dehydrogenase family protein [Nocardioides marmotae]MCR6030101.1 aldehyde dehydrogenase family protein [Gordonia jinghuaiqii]MTB93732.1 aldehyde dehydrogenase family protein [Nocardioides marmotae]QKE00075.1 aldehyde dehydrogenase family protein [Nocardioides marmotae]
MGATTTIDAEARLLIGGELRHAAEGRTFEVLNPADAEVIAHVANAGAGDMEAAIAAARHAFDATDWSTNLELRVRCLRQLQAALEGEREVIREELIAEVGTPRAVTHAAQLDNPLADSLLWPAEYAEGYRWERRLEDWVDRRSGRTNQRWAVKEAVGVVAAIPAWNFPLNLLLSKLGPALAAGNTVVAKPSPETPLHALRIGRLIAEMTDIPPGVVNIVSTDEVPVANLLLTDPRVDLVSFTGSTRTGEHVLRETAPTFKRTVLELGGKSALVITDDAPAELAAAMPMIALTHAGQACALPTRLLAQRGIYDEIVAAIRTGFENAAVGDPTDPRTVVGPVSSAEHQQRILGYIEKGKAEGATLLVGGDAPRRPGFWVNPTLFVDVDNSSTIAQEEIFGPVLAVTPFDTDEEAIALANSSRYGLSGYVVSSSTERARRIAKRVRSGSFMVNGGSYSGADAPFGGYKSSGIGCAGGEEGFEEFLLTKTVGTTLSIFD